MSADVIKRIYHRITLRYLCGLLLFGMLVAGKQFVAMQIVDSEKHDAQLINLSGKQRALAQQISFVALELHHKEPASRLVELQGFKKDAILLNSLIEEMARGHNILTIGDKDVGIEPPKDARLTTIYYSDDYALDTNVRSFLASAREVSAAYASADNIDPLVEKLIAKGGQLIWPLDEIVFVYEEVAKEKIELLRQINTLHVVGFVLLLLFEVAFIFRPLAKRVRATMEEVLAEKQKVREALDQQYKIASFAEVAPDPIIRVSAEGRILYANATASPIIRAIHSGALDVEREAGMSYGLLAVIQEQALFAAYVDGKSYSCVAVPYGDGEFVNLYFRDITELKATEERALKLQRMEAIGQLTGGVAHDFNNLLMVINGSLQMAHRQLSQDDINVEKAKSMIETACGAADRSAKMTKSLLAFSRRQTLAPEALAPNDVIEEFMPLLSNAAGGGTLVTFDRMDGSDLLSSLDRGLFESALLNLVINARDAMPKGGNIHIETKAFTLSVTLARKYDDVAPGNYLMVSITDDGTGIPKDVQDRVFEPFFTTKEVGQGSGLGLSMIWGFLKQSGGYLTIYSEEGIGTTVRMFLPVTNRAFLPEETPSPLLSPAMVGNSNLLVLVIEDDPRIAETVEDQLTSLGHGVIRVTSAEDAMDVLEYKKDIRVVLSDVVLPGGMTGPQLAARMAQKFKHIPVILTTGFAGQSVAVVRGHQVLTKPFSKEELSHALNAVLISKAA